MIYLQKILFQTITNLEQKKVKIGLIMKSVTIPYKNRHIFLKKSPYLPLHISETISYI